MPSARPARPPKPAYRCSECGWETGKWVGRCGECQAWGSVAESAAPTREPGVGKSTLLLEVAAQTARYRHRTLYVTGEESASQVRLRADRTNAVEPELFLAAETDLGALLTHVEETRPTLLVVDSVQTIGAPGVDGVPGGVTQVKEVAAALIRVAKTRNITTPAHGCSSTSSTWCCTSRATATAGSGWSVR